MILCWVTCRGMRSWRRKFSLERCLGIYSAWRDRALPAELEGPSRGISARRFCVTLSVTTLRTTHHLRRFVPRAKTADVDCNLALSVGNAG